MTATYLGAGEKFDVSSEDGKPTLTFNNDGSKMYVLGGLMMKYMVQFYKFNKHHLHLLTE